MKEIWKPWTSRVVLALMLLGPGTANAAISIYNYLDIVFNASGECQLIITPLEPYSNMNAECNLLEIEGETVVRQDNNENLSGGFSIGSPPRSQEVFSWLTLLVGAQPGEVFCQEFGTDDPTFTLCPAEIDPPLSITLGHVSSASQNDISCGKRACNSTVTLTLPEYDIWHASVICFGPPDDRVSGYFVLNENAPVWSRQVDLQTGSSSGSVCIYTQYVPPLQW